MQLLRVLNCGNGGDKVQHVLWLSHNLPVVKSIKKVVALCGTNNLNQDSFEDIIDSIIEVASTFKSKYGSISIFDCGILSRDFNWSVTGVYIKEVNDLLKTKYSQLRFTLICPDSDCPLSNGFLDPDLFYLDNIHLVENGNLELVESVFSLIKNFDNVKYYSHIQFNKCYKMAVYFKLNNADFPLLSFPNFLRHTPLFLCNYHNLLHVVPCLIMSVYHLSILLILLINFFLWFQVFNVTSLFLTKCKFYPNFLCMTLILVFQ